MHPKNKRPTRQELIELAKQHRTQVAIASLYNVHPGTICKWYKRAGIVVNWKAGERHWNAKLTADDVRLLREAHGQISAPELAEKFGVTAHTVWETQNYINWRRER